MMIGREHVCLHFILPTCWLDALWSVGGLLLQVYILDFGFGVTTSKVIGSFSVSTSSSLDMSPSMMGTE